jgi:hypothetical protein
VTVRVSREAPLCGAPAPLTVSCTIRSIGLVTLRHNGRLRHIGAGRPRAGTRVLLLVQDLHIRVINVAPVRSQSMWQILIAYAGDLASLSPDGKL